MSLAPLATPAALPSGNTVRKTYAHLLEQLNTMSVHKAHDPFSDIAWDAPENRIDPRDPRLQLPATHPLVGTRWYAGLSEDERTRFSVAWLAQTLKYGVGFEAVLNRGLLRYAQGLPNRSPEFRYVMHEVVEEGRHSLMFQELINRLGEDPLPVSRFHRFADDRVAACGRTFPELFFFAVLGGEIFVDRQNRELLRQPRQAVHPLVRRVVQIHVTEEARHLCFAEQYLREHLSRLSRSKKLALSWIVPTLLTDPCRMMLVPTRALTRAFGIPDQTLREAFGPGTPHRDAVVAAARPVRKLCEQHGLFGPAQARLWRRLGLVHACPAN